MPIILDEQLINPRYITSLRFPTLYSSHPRICITVVTVWKVWQKQNQHSLQTIEQLKRGSIFTRTIYRVFLLLSCRIYRDFKNLYRFIITLELTTSSKFCNLTVAKHSKAFYSKIGLNFSILFRGRWEFSKDY